MQDGEFLWLDWPTYNPTEPSVEWELKYSYMVGEPDAAGTPPIFSRSSHFLIGWQISAAAPIFLCLRLSKVAAFQAA